SWGNLVSRSLNMSAKYFEGKTPALPEGWAERENTLRTIAQGLEERYAACMDVFDYVGAKDAIMELVHAANHYIEDTAPWSVAKDPARADELEQIITNLLESIRICAHLFEPFMPETSAEVLRRLSLESELNCDDLAAACTWGGLVGEVSVTKGSALFPRLATKK
ncbi:MAG: class I tRNA ligase family protein, partial [Coriobacteriales bacterium]|nr:class I tRNA ligase family protein [Coriobacteriales bacterium]